MTGLLDSAVTWSRGAILTGIEVLVQPGVGQKNAHLLVPSLEGVQMAPGVNHANSLAGQLICDIAVKVDHILWSNFSCHSNAAGARG